MKSIVLLGASGSIGTQTLDIVRKHPTLFECVGMSVGRDTTQAITIIEEFRPKVVVARNVIQQETLRQKFPEIEILCGEDALVEIAGRAYENSELYVVNALVGSAGLRSTMQAIEAGYSLALANKESLVMAGELIMNRAKEKQVSIYPIDSEHSAIYQCLLGEEISTVKRLIITASGGSFRDKAREELANVTVKEALKHPNWSMGNKITIDSATMMNKGFEVIEAHHLFQLPIEKIETMLHKESIVHSIVEFHDTSMKAQLGCSDMRIPILFALSAPKRIQLNIPSLDLLQVHALHFEILSQTRFPCLRMAYEAIKKGNIYPTVLNAANEAAVNLFLQEKIQFLEIETIIEEYLNRVAPVPILTIDEILGHNDAIQEEIFKRFGGK